MDQGEEKKRRRAETEVGGLVKDGLDVDMTSQDGLNKSGGNDGLAYISGVQAKNVLAVGLISQARREQ